MGGVAPKRALEQVPQQLCSFGGGLEPGVVGVGNADGDAIPLGLFEEWVILGAGI